MYRQHVFQRLAQGLRRSPCEGIADLRKELNRARGRQAHLTGLWNSNFRALFLAEAQRVSKIGNLRPLAGTHCQISLARFAHPGQPFRRAPANAADLYQLRRLGRQHAAHRSEALDQRVSQLAHVLPRNCIKQQQFQHLMRIERIQSLRERAFAQTLPMPFMDVSIVRHCLFLHNENGKLCAQSFPGSQITGRRGSDPCTARQ